ncbi:MAG: hypothetical protein KGD57_06785 [Candidatus Lokiarchaeota archaeon]|nr:hypothetical protein [Candidatus Lokiarchaeota archaeon]
MKKIANISIDSKFSDHYDSCVYMLKCYKSRKALQEKSDDFIYYTDITKDPVHRLEEHIKKQDIYTKRFKGNVEVSYIELYNDLITAQRRKEQLKKFRRIEKESLITKKVAGVCAKCHDKMIKSIIIDNDGKRKQILQCSGCKFWKVLPIDF